MKCVQCGKETDYKQLKNGAWACKECLDKLGFEQKRMKEEIEDIWFGSGCEDYESVCNCIYNMIEIISYINNTTSVHTIQHLIDSLKAIEITLRYQNGLLSDEDSKKIESFIENW